MISRGLLQNVKARLNKGKVIVLFGPRQVGKTTMVNELIKNEFFLFLDGYDSSVCDVLSTANTETLKNIIGNYKYIFIDEVQRIPNISVKLKIIVD